MHKIMAQKEIMNFLAIMKILSGVHQGMQAETGIKVSTLFGLTVVVLCVCVSTHNCASHVGITKQRY